MCWLLRSHRPTIAASARVAYRSFLFRRSGLAEERSPDAGIDEHPIFHDLGTRSGREAKQHGEELGLSSEETAFYDALAENGSAKEVMKSDQLRLMARELAEMVKKMSKLDSARKCACPDAIID